MDKYKTQLRYVIKPSILKSKRGESPRQQINSKMQGIRIPAARHRISVESDTYVQRMHRICRGNNTLVHYRSSLPAPRRGRVLISPKLSMPSKETLIMWYFWLDVAIMLLQFLELGLYLSVTERLIVDRKIYFFVV